MSPPFLPEPVRSLPECSVPRSSQAGRAWLCRIVAALLLVGTAGLRIAFMASADPLDLSPDEGHYWDWSRHPDWCYYSKGPVVSHLIGVSCALTEHWTRDLPGQAMLSVRLPAVLCGCLLLLSVYVLTVLVFQREGWALAAVVLGLTLPPVTAVSEIMTIDAPFLCSWSWALVFCYLALFRGQDWAWPLTGLMIAIGILAKYTMILWLPSLVLFAWFTPSQRHMLATRGFWIMTAVASLGGLPILWWNHQHDWVTFHHLLGHSGLPSGKIHWLGPLAYVGMQAALFLLYWFGVWALAMWVHRPWKSPRRQQGTVGDGRQQSDSLAPEAMAEPGRPEPAALAYLWWMSLPTFVFFLAFTLKNGGGEPNWPVSAYLSGMVLAIGWLVEQLNDARRWYRLLSRWLLLAFVVIGLGMTLLIHHTSVIYPLLTHFCGEPTRDNPMPLRRLDPTCRLQGWRPLAAAVDKVRHDMRERGEEEPIIAGDHWSLPGIIAFYCQGQPTVYSLGPLVGDRHSQYDFWHPNPDTDPEQFRGRTFLLVGTPHLRIARAFRKMEGHHDVVHYVAGEPVNRWTIWIGRDFQGVKPLSPLERSH